MNKAEIGELVPVLISNQLYVAIITGYLDENRAILDHIPINIYKALIGNNIVMIDDTIIHNGQSALEERNYE